MNEADSKKTASTLEKNGYSPALCIKEADLVVINMCSVRQSAVDRVLGIAQKISEKQTSVLLGCILKKDKQKFEKIFDYVKPEKWNKILKKQKAKQSKQKPNISENVPIMTGCNNYCSYCVVPYVRGKEISMPAKRILSEVKSLISRGTKEIWLLGQNVNSYKDKNIDFPKLLEMINGISGDFWIRFTSSHPKDFSDKLADAMAKLNKVSPYLNLPAQSGDNEILKAMNRHYSIKHYLKLIEDIRKKIPNIAISTDIIVGFPNETKKQFENTKKLFEKAKYDMAYINKYSARPGTASFKLKDSVPIKEKKRREQVLTEILKRTALENNQRFIGKIEPVLTQSEDSGFLIGKTRHYKTIRFEGNKNLVGQFIKVKITGATPWGLKGKIV